MTKEQILERERRWARPVALAALLTIVLFVISALVSTSGDASAAEANEEFLPAFADETGRQLAITILQAIGLALIAFPLLYLFQAAAARSDRVRTALVGITVAGPVFLALALIARYVTFENAAAEFVAGSPAAGQTLEEFADRLIEDQTAWGITQGLNFAGILGLMFGVVYTSLWAMRVGLLTRFWGTLGMALAVSVLFLGTVFGILLFVLVVGLLVAGLWPGGRPPAWDAGEAVPWPRPGEKAERAREESPPSEDEPGLPEGFGEPRDPSEERDDSRTVEGPPGEPPAPRKRKRRG